VALRLATRGSALALAQARQVAEMLGGAELVEVSGDGGLGDKSRFVRGVESALIEGQADIGVHSAKDLPSAMPAELMIAGVPAREDPLDAWVGAGSSLDDVPEGARVGTASLRRRAQLLALRPDLRVSELHGNVDTRLRKLAEGDFDGVVLAAAGLRRLGREGEIAFRHDPAGMTPAAGQGTLILQTRRSDAGTLATAASVSDEAALLELTAERAAIGMLGASCATPVGIHAKAGAERMIIDAFVGLPDGSEWIRDTLEGAPERASETGAKLAERLLGAGAREILKEAEVISRKSEGAG
jgi:hydroxymethylbilane synthase